MKIYTLTLTEAQADILGFALVTAKKQQLDRADTAEVTGKAQLANGCRRRASRIEEIRDLLDCCPITDATAPT